MTKNEFVSLATYEKEYALLRQQLLEVLPDGFDDVHEATRIELLLPPSANMVPALKIAKRMRALTRLTFSRLEE